MIFADEVVAKQACELLTSEGFPFKAKLPQLVPPQKLKREWKELVLYGVASAVDLCTAVICSLNPVVQPVEVKVGTGSRAELEKLKLHRKDLLGTCSSVFLALLVFLIDKLHGSD